MFFTTSPSFTFLFTLLSFFSFHSVCCFQSYQSKIPNGNKVKVNSQNWPGVGHERAGGGGPRNVFGLDFAAAGKKWTNNLCQKDSDGDGLTNGEELGDPDCKWTEGTTPQFDAGLSHPGYASKEEINREIDSCVNYIPPSPVETISSQVNLTFTPFQVPPKRTTYAKYAFHIADYVNDALNTNKPFYGVRFGIINKNPNVVHHAILYGCEKKPSLKILKEPSETGTMNCESVRYAWAIGGKDFCLPNTKDLSVGIQFTIDKPWHVLEIHYDNPTSLSSIMDTSGVSIVLAQQKLKSPHSFRAAGFLWAGVGLSKLSIPPKLKSYHVSAKCNYPNIPNDGISVFAYINHAHLLGRKLWTSLERKNKYLHDLGCDAQYDFDLQQIIPFEKHVTLYNTDNLYANCVYDSTERDVITEGGDATNNEMCINFLVYYPEINDLNKCLVKPRIMSSTSLAENKKCCSGATRTNTTNIKCSGSVHGAGSVGNTKLPTWLLIHIICMLFGWLFFFPIGIIIASCFKNYFNADGQWFKYHKICNSIGIFCIFVGVSTSIASVGEEDHFNTPHKILGMIVFIFTLCQPINAYIRPSHEKKSKGRWIWEFVHKSIGRSTFLLAIINCILGVIVVRSNYFSNPLIIIIIIILFIISMVILFIYYKMYGPFNGKNNTSKSSSVAIVVEMPTAIPVQEGISKCTRNK
jgi:dopamine beta-monooxygenase